MKTPKQTDSDETTRFCKSIRTKTYDTAVDEIKRVQDAENK